jgi:alkylation response protein AidB-like acyl-CoA dehydrogenase
MIKIRISTQCMHKNSGMLQEIIQEFGRTRIIPYHKQWDEVQALPTQFFEQLGELGMMGGLVPKKHGGLGLNPTQYATVVEEFAKLDAAVALSMLAHNSLCMGHILRLQKQGTATSMAS